MRGAPALHTAQGAAWAALQRGDSLASAGRRALFGLVGWATLVALVGSQALPGGNIFALLVLFTASILAGKAVACTTIPPLLGMMVTGVLLRNVPWIDVGEDVDPHWSSALRSAALVVILARAGLGLDLDKLRRLGAVCMRLGLIPNLCEAAVDAALAMALLGTPLAWALMLGFVLSAVSPAVVVPSLLHLQSHRYGTAKGIPSLVLASASFDDVLSISAFGLCLGLAFSEANLAFNIVRGPLELLGGLAFGVASGVLCVAAFPTPPPPPHPDNAGPSVPPTPASALETDEDEGSPRGKPRGRRASEESEGDGSGVHTGQEAGSQPADAHAGTATGGEVPACSQVEVEGSDEERGVVDSGKAAEDVERDEGEGTTLEATPAAAAAASSLDPAPEKGLGRQCDAATASEAGSGLDSASEDVLSPDDDDDDGSSDGSGGEVSWAGPEELAEARHRAPLRAGALMALGLFAVLGGKAVHYAGAGALAVIVMGAVAGKAWTAPAVAEAKTMLGSVWTLAAQPLLFVLIGAAVSTADIHGSFIAKGLLILACGLVVRLAATAACVSTPEFRPSERLFIALAWLPKATVQAAIGSVALDTARERAEESSLAGGVAMNATMAGTTALAAEEERGVQILTLAVLSILVTAPIGAIAIATLGPKLLEKEEDAPEPGVRV